MTNGVRIEFWFNSYEEMRQLLDNTPLARHRAPVREYGDRPAIDPNEPPPDPQEPEPGDPNMSNLASITSVEDDEAEPAAQDNTPLKTPPDAASSPARPRKRRAYLRHQDGRCIETLDQDVVDQWTREGAQYISKKQYEAELAATRDKPSSQSPGEVIDMPPRNVKWDDVRDMVRRVNAECSLTRLKELLAEFGHGRVGELTEDQYAPFVRRAIKAIEAAQKGASNG